LWPAQSHPGAPFEDPDRVKLLEMIAEKLRETACAQRITLGDKEPLLIYYRLLVSKVDYKPSQRSYHYVQLTVFYSGPQKDNNAESRASSAPQTPVKTAKKTRIDKPSRKEKDICEACHLYSYWMNDENTKGVKLFLNTLRELWSDTIPRGAHCLRASDYGVALHDVRNDCALLSGETVRLKSHDPENYPLPDTWILEMQWILNHVSVLSGATKESHPSLL
ncbi:hypothetical protein GB937_010064, partial [Aspergillus fischeri]